MNEAQSGVDALPTLEDLRRLLASHVEEHRRLPESARVRDLGAERTVWRDYDGRVVHELLQNALDRADRRIEVRWRQDGEGGTLIVGNDGLPVSAYPRPRDEEAKRSDLHAILSLHSSAKSAGESVGNKGIGFRSVFAFAPEVEVWSRAANGGWWGIRLRHPADLEPEPAIAWNDREVASFYAPEFLEGPPPDGTDLVTVIRLPRIPPESAGRVRDAIGELAARPLAFLERRARYRDGRLHVTLDDGKTQITRPVALESRHAHAETVGIPVPEEVRRRTGLDLRHAEVRVLLPPPKEGGEPVYWSYLPTERASGHGVHVHADFYLQSSRRDVAFRPVFDASAPADPNGWNGWLLREAARLVVDELWRDPKVLARDDFWALAAPGAARCAHFRMAVAYRLLGVRGRFRQLVSDAFAHPPEGGWTVRRYRDFFNALEVWSLFAYHHPSAALHGITGQRQMDWRNHLIGETRASGASVVPIVEHSGEEAGRTVAHAEPLPGKGGTRIYLRRTEGFRLPAALRRQGTQVTTFAPMPSREPRECGLLEFERPEVLAHVAPGVDEHEHRELLDAVLRLATEQPTLGGVGSVAARGPGLQDPRPYWRHLVNEGPMAAAGRALARLMVPIEGGGWAPAGTTVLGPGWNGAPSLDVDRLAAIARPAWLAPAPFDIIATAALLGIGPVPLGAEGGAPTMPALNPGVSVALLHRWEAALGPVVESFESVRRVLVEASWIDGTVPAAALGGTLLAGELRAFPLRPADVWWQDPRRGFRTRLLPVIERQHGPSPWMAALGVCAVGEGGPEKTLGALESLRARPELLASRPAEVEAVYTALVRDLPEAAGGPHVPVLVRRVAKDGRARELGWRREAEDAWFDGGKVSHALAAFGDYALWVVRRDAARLAHAIGLRSFEPGAPLCRTEGEEVPELRDEFLSALWRALPDLFAAAAHAPIQPRFDGDAAVRAAATLRARHAPRAWLEYSFADRTGKLGEDEGEDVFLVPGEDGGAPSLVFDGDKVQLPSAAGGLSELLCGNRAYVHVFASGLVAWSGAVDDAEPPGVRRFRREHGLAEAEVAGWRERLAATRMEPAARAAWRAVVVERLGAFGAVDLSRVDVDRPITPAAWTELARVDATEESLAASLSDLAPAPRVLFAPTYRRAFLEVDRVPVIAEAADLHVARGWTEAFYAELRETAEREPTPEEESAFQVLGCDVEALWRTRFGLPAHATVPSLGALAFARGQIPLTSLPTPEATPGTLLPWSATAATIGLAPLQDDEWLKRARRQATGGARAEDAVLARALESAESWRGEDPEGFAAALRAAWSEAWSEKRVKDVVEAALATGKLKRALHAAGLVGNAGYDLLVPDASAGRFLKVEVKRVERLEDAAFFLSENERRQALTVGADWRLWLVSGDGRARDVTWVRGTLEKVEPPVAQVLALGLRPGEWLVRVG